MDTWKFYVSVAPAWEAMLSSMEKAESRIDFEQYSLEDTASSQIGGKFAEMFLRKSRQGVKVRVILDGLGSWKAGDLLTRKELEESGVKLIFHYGVFGKVARLFRMFFRDHRKLCIVDNRVAFIGGVIVSERAAVWRDSLVMLTGPVVPALGHFFEEAWQSLSNSKRPVVSNPIDVDKETRVVASGPRVAQSHMLVEMLRIIDKARTSICITSPYLNPPKVLEEALMRAANRGVSVEVILPKRSDNFPADLASYSFFKSFLQKKIKILLYPSYVHAKSMVVDGSWAAIGSTNLDRLSLLHNYELNIVSRNEKFVSELAGHFREDSSLSETLTEEILQNYPLSFKTLSFLSRLFRHII